MSERWPGGLISKTPVTPTGPNYNGTAPGIWTIDQMNYWKKQGLWPDPSIVPDQYWAYVSYLLSTSALSNASNNLFVDSSGMFNPITRNGNTTQGSATPYGTLWSNYFDGSGDYLSTPYSTSNFDWWTSDFTLEAWVFPTNLSSWQDSGTLPNMVGNMNPTSATNYWSFGPVANGTVKFYYFTGGSVSSTATIAANAWSHIAMTKTASGITIFVNGVASATTALAGTQNSSNSVNLVVGAYNSSYVNGYVSNLRLVKGTAVYSGNFTPPTSPLTAITNTKLLTCQSNRFRDASTNNFAITKNGDTKVTAFSPFILPYPGAVYNQNDISYWSGYFNGSSYLSAPDSSGYTLNSAGWVFETFANFTSLPGSGNAASLAAQWYDGNLGWWFYLYNNAGTYQLYFSYSADGSSQTNISVNLSAAPQLNTWNHIAFAYFPGVGVGIFWNGVQVGTYQSFSGTVFNSTSAMQIGARVGVAGAGYYLNGYLSNMRLVNAPGGSYSWPETSPLTAVSGTTLLTLQNAAFTDNSTTKAVFTPVGNPVVTGNNPFQAGYYSNYFDGSGDYLSTSTSALPTTGNFTAETWFNRTSTADAILMYLRGGTGSYAALRVGCAAGGIYLLMTTADGTWVINSGVISTVSLDTWNHVAVVRNSNTITLFLNGVSIYTSTAIASGSALMSGSTSEIGRMIYGGTSDFFAGYISNLRVVSSAIYTTSFTPPTSPLTAISGTTLLTCQSNRFLDNSTNAFTVTPSGDTKVQTFNPFYAATVASNGGSMYFDGSGDWLSSPDSTNWDFPGDFTVEAWVYPVTGGVNRTIMSTYASPSDGWMLRTDAGTALSFTWGDSVVVSTTYTLPLNSWTHVACTRSGTTARLFVNGAVIATNTNSTNLTNSSPLYIGTLNTGNLSWMWNGYMASARIVKGTAVYTAAFTPPTVPVAPTTNTVLLVNGMNAGLYDASLNNDMETVGNAQVSNVQAKYGTTSAYFDGSGDYLRFPYSPAFDLSGANWTMEAWFNSSSFASGQIIIAKDTYGTNYDWSIQLVNSTTIALYTAGTASNLTVTVPTMATGTWYHVAFVRNNGVNSIYLNGVSYGSNSMAITNASQSFVTVGCAGWNSPNAFFNGYLDDLRVTKGVARYTANFTPPTAALPVY